MADNSNDCMSKNTKIDFENLNLPDIPDDEVDDLPTPIERSLTEPSTSVQSFNSSPLKRFCSTSSGQNKFQIQKNEILLMNIEEKRKLYKCKSKFIILSSIDSWAEYAIKNSYLLKKLSLSTEEKKDILGDKVCNVDLELNEKISIKHVDITCLEIDCIVNAANNTLLGGGGVDGAIHRGAGEMLDKECKTLNGCETGDAKITGGYNLPARFVIHAVGPVGEKPAKLESCYYTSLTLAVENGLRTIAFPCISTGIYGYPNKNAAIIAIQTVRNFLETNKDKIDRVIFVLFMHVDIEIYNSLMPIYFPIQNS